MSRSVTGITEKDSRFWWKADDRQVITLKPARGDRKIFFCQREAAETLIWLIEASPEGYGL